MYTLYLSMYCCEMETVLFVIFLLNTYQVLGLKCFTCSSDSHRNTCDYYGSLLTMENTNHIVECKGTCKVGTIRDKTDEAHLRMCEESTEIGCDEKEDGFICQCSTDYCNKNLITCHKESRCEQTLHRYTQKSDKETELHGNK